MSISYDQLAKQLQQSLAPIYHIHGDELLLQQDARQLIHAVAKKSNINNKQSILITSDTDWNHIGAQLIQTGLFADKQLFDCQHPTGKFDKSAVTVLTEYCQRPNHDNILVISTPKLTKAQLNTKFYKMLTQHSVSVKLWPVSIAQLPTWIKKRSQPYGLSWETEAIKQLAELTEGNLITTHQTIEKLRLAYPNGRITASLLRDMISDQQHFSIYDLTDAALLGNTAKTLQILHSLRDAHTEPVLILWNVIRQLRILVPYAVDVERGLSITQAIQSAWSSQKAGLQAALQRLNSQSILRLIEQCCELDPVIKGAKAGNFWQQCEQLLLNWCQTTARRIR